MHSILKNPGDEQFRLFKKTNAAIQNKLLCLQPDGIVIRLIEALGYSFLDNDFHAFNGSDADLAKGEKQIAEVVRYLKMTPEQKAKEDQDIKREQLDKLNKFKASEDVKQALSLQVNEKKLNKQLEFEKNV